jgi:hypothetical protein
MFNHIDRDEIHDVGADSGVLREGAYKEIESIVVGGVSYLGHQNTKKMYHQ